MKILILTLALSASAFSGFFGDPGEESFSFTRQFESAHTLARSQANTAGEAGLHSVRRNPALLALSSHRNYYINYGTESQGFTNASAGFSQPLWGAQMAVLLHVRTLTETIKEIDEQAQYTGATHRPWAEITQWVSSYSPYPGLRIAHSLQLMFSRLTQDAEDPTAWGAATDFGVYYQKDPRSMAWGFSINQLGKQFGGYLDESETSWLNTEFNAGIRYRLPSLPRLTLQQSLQFPAYGQTRFNNSLEYLFHRSFTLIASFSPAIDNIKSWLGKSANDDIEEIAWPFSGGIQVGWDFWQISYSVTPDPILNWHHQLSLTLGFM